jgi:hypothetical protein
LLVEELLEELQQPRRWPVRVVSTGPYFKTSVKAEGVEPVVLVSTRPRELLVLELQQEGEGPITLVTHLFTVLETRPATMQLVDRRELSLAAPPEPRLRRLMGYLRSMATRVSLE